VTVTNTLSYHDTDLNTTVKSFQLLVRGAGHCFYLSQFQSDEWTFKLLLWFV